MTKPVGIAVVALLSLLAVAQIIRTASVADRLRRPGLAGTLWPGHPSVLTDQLLLEVASAAVHGQQVSSSVRGDVRRLAIRAPLSPDPYLIEAAIAQTQGRGTVAEGLLLAARDRDPRSRGTRFLLADRFLRTGRIVAGINEIRVLVGLSDKGAEGFYPMLAAYARTPGSDVNLKPLFRQHPVLELGVLSLLAPDVGNADLVLSLADRRRRNPQWLGIFAATLAQDGQYSKAYSGWKALSGNQNSSVGLFNPNFVANEAPPPFNWEFPQSSEGIAEPDGKGGLEVLFYGRANALLARQLMMLQPGAYRLSHAAGEVSGAPETLRWTVRCAKPAADLAGTLLAARSTALDLQVPVGCEAVWLELQGLAGETPQTTSLTIRNLRLARKTQ